MLKKIRVRNFKPFGEVEAVRLAPITLVFGPNSSGKSSLVQSLLMMSQTLNGQQPGSQNDLITRGSMIDLGNFSSILHRHDHNNILKIEYEFDDSIENILTRQGQRNPFIGLSLNFGALQLSSKHIFPVLQSVGFRVNDFDGREFEFSMSKPDSTITNQLINKMEEEEGDEEAVFQNEIRNNSNSARSERDNTFKLNEGMSLEKLSKFISKYQGLPLSHTFLNSVRSGSVKPPDDYRLIHSSLKHIRLKRERIGPMRSEFIPTSPIPNRHHSVNGFEPGAQHLRNILSAYDYSLRKTLGGLTYLGPLRTHPARHYMVDGVPGNSVGSKGEQVVQILFNDLEAGNGVSPLLSQLNEYCKSFDIPYKFDLRNVGDEVTGDVIVLSLTDTRTNVRVGPADVGFGIGQLLPILIEGILINERGLSSRMVCVEQPEIHLHPRLQAAMADFFIDTSLIRGGRSRSRPGPRRRGGVQWILETHSEALMLRLQRRIREKQISHEDISVLYVDPRGEKGSVIQELRLDEDGEFIDLWPDGFFVESLSDVLGGR